MPWHYILRFIYYVIEKQIVKQKQILKNYEKV